MIDQSTFDFLADLKKNNRLGWYHANKERFNESLLNFIDFVAMILFRISEFVTDMIGTEPKNCLFRIYRDIRFSNDKTPYKTWFSAGMNPGERKQMCAWHYIHVGPGDCYIPGSVLHPYNYTLSALREYIIGWPNQFNAIVNESGFVKMFGGTKGDKLNVAPKGYPNDHLQIQWLRYKDFIVSKNIHDEELQSGKCFHTAYDV